jgi:ATP-dependent protease Clp ATPase subunit
MFELPSLRGVEEVVINKDTVGKGASPRHVYAKAVRDDRAG